MNADGGITLFYLDHKHNEVDRSTRIRYYKKGIVVDGKTIVDPKTDYELIFKHFRSVIKHTGFHHHPKVTPTMNYYNEHQIHVLE